MDSSLKELPCWTHYESSRLIPCCEDLVIQNDLDPEEAGHVSQILCMASGVALHLILCT